MNFYNDNDRGAAAWLRELIKARLLPRGAVDERSIKDLKGAELKQYDQCHLFAGIGGWPYALRLAGWPAKRLVWTGSCPCQPFSTAGKRLGKKDARDLWPEFLRLIAECRPATIFGEQVASCDGRIWLAGVRREMEALGYRVGAADLCAAGLGAPHIRQRIFWVADAKATERRGTSEPGNARRGLKKTGRSGGAVGPLPDTAGPRSARPEDAGSAGAAAGRGTRVVEPKRNSAALDGSAGTRALPKEFNFSRRGLLAAGAWRDCEIIRFGNGKRRRIEPGLAPLVDGFPGRMGLLRGYGNAIVPQVAAEFVRAAVAALEENEN